MHAVCIVQIGTYDRQCIEGLGACRQWIMHYITHILPWSTTPCTSINIGMTALRLLWGVWQSNSSTAACPVSMIWSKHLRRDPSHVKLAAAAAAEADIHHGYLLVTDLRTHDFASRFSLPQAVMYLQVYQQCITTPLVLPVQAGSLFKTCLTGRNHAWLKAKPLRQSDTVVKSCITTAVNSSCTFVRSALVQRTALVLTRPG